MIKLILFCLTLALGSVVFAQQAPANQDPNDRPVVGAYIQDVDKCPNDSIGRCSENFSSSAALFDQTKANKAAGSQAPAPSKGSPDKAQ